jgi:hypothetical protein
MNQLDQYVAPIGGRSSTSHSSGCADCGIELMAQLTVAAITIAKTHGSLACAAT